MNHSGRDVHHTVSSRRARARPAPRRSRRARPGPSAALGPGGDDDYGAVPGVFGLYASETVRWTSAAVVPALVGRVRALPGPEVRRSPRRVLLGRRPAVDDGLADDREDHGVAQAGRQRRGTAHDAARASTSTATAPSARRTPAGASSARRYEIGVGNIMWGNDFPHPEGTWPHTASSCSERVLRHPGRRDRSRCSASTRPSSTASTSTSCARSPSGSARRPRSSARPTPSVLAKWDDLQRRRPPVAHRQRGGAGRTLDMTLDGRAGPSSPAVGAASVAASRWPWPRRVRAWPSWSATPRPVPRTVDEITAIGDDAIGVAGSVRDRADCEAIVAAAVDRFGGVDASSTTRNRSDRSARRVHRRRHVRRVGVGRARRLPPHAAVSSPHDGPRGRRGREPRLRCGHRRTRRARPRTQWQKRAFARSPRRRCSSGAPTTSASTRSAPGPRRTTGTGSSDQQRAGAASPRNPLPAHRRS